jgi:ribosomal protein L21
VLLSRAKNVAPLGAPVVVGASVASAVVRAKNVPELVPSRAKKVPPTRAKNAGPVPLSRAKNVAPLGAPVVIGASVAATITQTRSAQAVGATPSVNGPVQTNTSLHTRSVPSVHSTTMYRPEAQAALVSLHT